MLKIPKKLSISISLVISVLLFFACLAGIFLAPPLIDMIIDMVGNFGSRGEIDAAGRTFIFIMAYLVLLAMLKASVFMFALLRRVKSGLVFTEKSVACIRAVSWCCFLTSAAFFGLGIYFQLSFIVAFVAGFLGMCLRVVKNAFEEAAEIKSENDLTV